MISEETAKFVNRQKLGFVATISEDGTPSLSPKGSLIALDSKTLAFADIRSPTTVKNLSLNPSTEINVVDPLLRKGYRFAGRARIIRSGDKFDEIHARYKKDGMNSSFDVLVLVDVSDVSEIVSPAYDSGLSESEMKSKWKKHFSDT